ncbi:MAG: hypothetical protein ABI885_14445, partial [Gammaproteobacteria bacterium]
NEDKLIITPTSQFGDGRACTPPAGQQATADCSNYGSYVPFTEQTYFTPRRIGVQVNYKF